MNRDSFWIIDAFTGQWNGRMLRGNPAAVVLLDEFASDDQLLECANEFNLSETAFVVPRGEGRFDLRWFTPQVEVDLCGHATLATARALLDAGLVGVGESARFSTRSGELTALVGEQGIELDFPAQECTDVAVPAHLRVDLGMGHHEVLFCGKAGTDWVIRVEPQVLETLRPNFKKLALLEGRGVIVTALARRGEEGYDFASRFFGPRVGIEEDPVTGSAHTSLAPFWAERLGKKQLRAIQLSARGGLLELEVRDRRVGISGRARIRARGQLCD